MYPPSTIEYLYDYENDKHCSTFPHTDQPPAKRLWLPYAHIFVEVEASEPLPHNIKLCLPNGVTIKQSVDYEWVTHVQNLQIVWTLIDSLYEGGTGAEVEDITTRQVDGDDHDNRGNEAEGIQKHKIEEDTNLDQPTERGRWLAS